MADSGANGTEVHGNISIYVEVRSLQYRCREYYVAQKTVVGVEGLRRHAPVALVHWTVAAAAIEGPVCGRRTADVADEVIVEHNHARIITRVIRVPDLDDVGIELA